VHPVIWVTVAVTFPLACLGLLLGLAYLEDTLPADVRRSQRRSSPEPVRSFPVAAVEVQDAKVIPMPRRPVQAPASARTPVRSAAAEVLANAADAPGSAEPSGAITGVAAP
jgi:hypothetical protein